MTDKKPTYSKIEIEIADTLFAYPDKKIADVQREFAEKCGKSVRTVERWVKKAQEYNKTRIKKREKVKDEVLADSAKESIKRDILNREEAEEILSGIAKGKARRLLIENNNVKKTEILIPNDKERIAAITQLAKMSSWDAPIKNEHTGKDGKPLFSLPDLSNLSDDEIVALYTLLEKTKGSE